MNYLQLAQRFNLEMKVGPGGGGTLPPTVVGLTDEDLRHATYCAQAWIDIQEKRPDWRWRQATCRLETVSGTQDYSIASQRTFSISGITRSGSTATATTASAHNLSTGDEVTVSGAGQTEYNVTASITVTGTTTFTYTVSGAPATPATGTLVGTKVVARFGIVQPNFAMSGLPYLLCHLVSLGVTDQQPVYRMSWEDFGGFYNRGNTLQAGRPTYYAIKPDGQIALWPVPDNTYRVTIPYVKSIQTLAANTDTPEMPERYHMAIVYLAATYKAGSTESMRAGEHFERLFRTKYSELVRDQVPDVNVMVR